MKKIILILLYINISLFAQQSILILNSYHKGYEWSDNINDGINQLFKQSNKYLIDNLYMDTKRNVSNEYIENLIKLYTLQLQNRKYDLVIAIDRFAYNFVLNNYKIFNNAKVLSVGIENYSKENTKKFGLENQVSALIEKRDLKSNVRLIKKLIPDVEKIYVIDDKSLTSKHTEPLLKELFQDMKSKYSLIKYDAKNLEELRSEFTTKIENSAILFIRYYKNSDGSFNTNNEINDFIKNSNLPVFVTDTLFLRDAATAGKAVDLDGMGYESAKMAVKILKGNDPKIKVYDKLKYIADEQKFIQFRLDYSLLPKSAILINKNSTFFEKYRAFIDFMFTLSPLLLLLIIGLIHNIYRRKKAEEVLIERLEFDNVLLNAIETPIFWQDDQKRVIDSNTEFCSLIGVSCADLYGYTLESLIPKYPKIKKISNLVMKYEKKRQESLQFEYITEENIKKIYLLKQTNYFHKKSQKSGVVTVFTDITKEKEIEKEREKSQEFAVQQSKLAEIGEIFSAIAHQWKAPLVEITTIAQETFYSNGIKEEEKSSFVNDIMVQVKYMNDTIDDFQEFIKPSNKKALFDVKEAIETLLDIVEHNIKFNYINININLKEGTNTNILGYRNEFMQSFLNIINNSKDQLVKNEFKNRNIWINLYNENNTLVIKVEDNAGGISQKNINNIFMPYFSTKKDGHGIGLYMTKVIIENKMNGTIDVTNTNNGAEFTIILEQSSENTYS